MNHRDAILEGAKRATRLHDVLGTREGIEQTGGRIDVFDAALHQGSTLLFRELNKIIGAYLNENGSPGIMVTTQRPLSVQRFTGAHELGHFFMGHAASFDGDEILGSSSQLATVEVQANAFAAEFLAPKWLLMHHGRRQGWNAASIKTPIVVYQLSLRLGLSYEATCHSLRTHEIVAPEVAQSLVAFAPKKIKRQILPESYEPVNWFPDVWLLTEKDRGARIEGQPEDLFVLQLREQSGAGYLWDAESLRREGFEIISDERSKIDSSDSVGGSVLHKITAGAAPRPEGEINLSHRRPWQAQAPPLEQLIINYDVTGKEIGLSRAQRRQLHAA